MSGPQLCLCGAAAGYPHQETCPRPLYNAADRPAIKAWEEEHAALSRQLVADPEWNPRYVAYASEHGKDPDAMLAHDKERHPGACMMEFIFWIGARWREWDKLNGRSGEPHLTADHKAFDKWLAQRAKERN